MKRIFAVLLIITGMAMSVMSQIKCLEVNFFNSDTTVVDDIYPIDLIDYIVFDAEMYPTDLNCGFDGDAVWLYMSSDYSKGFELYRGTDSINYELIAIINEPLATRYSDYNIKAGTYYYKARAIGDGGLKGEMSAVKSITLDAKTLNVWRTIGTGRYANVWFSNEWYPVDVQVNDRSFDRGEKGYHGMYRLVRPFNKMALSDRFTYSEDEICQYVYFTVRGPGETFGSYTVPDGEWMLECEEIDTGIHDTQYDSDVVNFLFGKHVNYGNDGYSGQKVLSWQIQPTDENPKGLPDMLSFGFMVFLPNTGSASYLNNTGVCLFDFPEEEAGQSRSTKTVFNSPAISHDVTLKAKHGAKTFKMVDKDIID